MGGYSARGARVVAAGAGGWILRPREALKRDGMLVGMR